MAPPIVLVTGATGKQGGATARSLLASKAQVHALVRSPSSPAAQELSALGIILHAGTFDDPVSLTNALKANITSVFLNVCPSSEEGVEVRHASNVIRAAQAAGTVTQLVYPSIVETGRHETFPGWSSWDPKSFMAQYWLSKHRIECLVRDSGIRFWTILRPPTFMSNYHALSLRFFFPEVPTKHVFRTALTPSTRTMLISPDDIGRYAAAVLVQPAKYTHQEIDLGAEALTPAEITAALSTVGGKGIVPIQIPPDEAQELGKTNMGIASQMFFNERSAKIDLGLLRERFPGIRAVGFEEYLRGREKLVKESLR